MSGVGAWITVQPQILRAIGSPVDVNCILVLGDKRALLVDTGSSLADGQILRDASSRLLGGRQLVVANTHAHYDHYLGNGAFPSSSIWASVGCVKAITEAGESERQAAADEWRASDPSFAQGLLETPIVAPGRPIARSTTLDLGGCSAHLIHPGRGHTDHDLAVWIPELRALLAGDLVEESGPPALEGSWPLAWPNSLAALLRFEPVLVVPGHGRPVPVDFARQQLQQLEELASWCRETLAGTRPRSGSDNREPFSATSRRVALARAELELGDSLR